MYRVDQSLNTEIMQRAGAPIKYVISIIPIKTFVLIWNDEWVKLRTNKAWMFSWLSLLFVLLMMVCRLVFLFVTLSIVIIPNKVLCVFSASVPIDLSFWHQLKGWRLNTNLFWLFIEYFADDDHSPFFITCGEEQATSMFMGCFFTIVTNIHLDSPMNSNLDPLN